MWWTKHLFLSIILSAAYFLASKDPAGSLLVLISGVIVDADHIITGYIITGNKSLRKIYNLFVKLSKNNFVKEEYVLPFHSFEFYTAFIILNIFYPFLTPILIGSLSHFILDVASIRNFRRKRYYSFIFYTYVKLF